IICVSQIHESRRLRSMLPTAVAAAPPPIMTPLDPGVADRWRGWPATEGTAAGWTEMEQPVTGPGVLATGGCCASPLPLDATCAREARRVFTDAVAGLGLHDEVLGDGVTMVSELAANTLHAHDNVEVDGAGSFPLPGAP